ncbi:hypothetical protein [uncultured Kocuria sp.]|uniref:hypothetical protein n=1 Tax=uncultured Kocuria sp. TaxID=259305 RepID=UPI00263A31E5|nr:hypothetical protein [uncultured Kocuria sp.]
MFQQTVTTVLAAAEGGPAAAESGVPAWVWGVSIFVVLIGLLVVTLSYANRGLSPEVGEHEDPADLPADERAMLDEYAAKRHA